MPVNELIRIAKHGYLIISGIMLGLGTAMLIDPGISMNTLCMLGGWVLILFGIVKIIGYWSKDLYRLAFEQDLAAGLTVITLGIFILIHSERLRSLVIILLGIAIMADAYTKIQTSFDAREFGIRYWYRIFAAALITGVVGFVLVFRMSVGREVTVRTLGLALITEAVQNFTTIMTVVKIMKN